MEAQRIQLKLYARSRSVPLHAIAPVFQEFIRRGALDGLLIDVAQYLHVHHGPGIVLIGHRADYALDLGEGRPGLSYTRKRELPGPDERFGEALLCALRAGCLLEQQPTLTGELVFATDELRVSFPDRLRAPDTPASVAALQHELRERLEPGFGPVRVERDGRAGAPVTFRVKAPEAPGALQAVLDRVSPPRMP